MSLLWSGCNIKWAPDNTHTLLLLLLLLQMMLPNRWTYAGELTHTLLLLLLLLLLQMMLPNESFVEWVRSGTAAAALDVAALQRLAAAASCG
jgi:hypothetical protein